MGASLQLLIVAFGAGLFLGAAACYVWAAGQLRRAALREGRLADERLNAVARVRELQSSGERLIAQTAERIESAARDAHQAVRSRADARGGVSQLLAGLEDLLATLGGRGSSSDIVESSGRRAGESAAQAERGLRELGEQADGVSRVVDSATGIGLLVADAIVEVGKQVGGLTAASDETATAATQMDDALLRVLGGAGDTAQLSSKVVTEAEKGYRAVHRTLDEIEAIRRVTEQAAQRIGALGQRVSGIGDVVKMIQEIAEKTNLLALNASIIAAQAGEHGRGFAVVAQEIKALAQRTAASTKQISEQIRGVQDESKRAMEAMASGVKAVDQGFQVALGAGDALGEIRQSARTAQKKTQSIARAIDEQKDAARRVVEAAGQLVQRASVLGEQVRGESGHADQLRAGMRGVNEAVARLSRLAREQVQALQGVNTSVQKALGEAGSMTRSHKDLRKQVDLLHHGAAKIAGLEAAMADRLAQVNEATAELREGMARLA